MRHGRNEERGMRNGGAVAPQPNEFIIPESNNKTTTKNQTKANWYKYNQQIAKQSFQHSSFLIKPVRTTNKGDTQ
jgi:hypothetical protein